MNQKQKKKSRNTTKKIFSFFYRLNGTYIVGFADALNKKPKEETSFTEAGSEISEQAG